MDSILVISILKDAFIVLLKLSTPLLMVCLVIGILVSFFQALTQIQEATLSFVPKMIGLFVALIMLLPFMIMTITGYTKTLYQLIEYRP
jgi:flagellar biosynthetic protein FliQ